MNVIEKTKQIIGNILDSDEIHIDFTEEVDKCISLSTVGDSSIKNDILGNQVRIDNMELLITNLSPSEQDRIDNNSILLYLGYSLDSVKKEPITAIINNVQHSGYITKISTGNGQAYYLSEDRQYITYMMQIKVTYTIESEEI